MQHPALKLRHIGVRNLELRLVMRQAAQEVAQRVAQLAVGVHGGLDDVRPDTQILGVIGGKPPKPQDIRAGLLDDILRRYRIAQRFRHLAALLVHARSHASAPRRKALARACRNFP